MAADAVDETQILADQFAHTLAFAVVGVSRDIIDFRDLVFRVVSIRVRAVIEEVAGCIVTTASDAIVCGGEVKTLIAAAEIDPAIAITVIAVRLGPS